MHLALEKSIEHWQRLAACETLDEIEKEGTSAIDCALCKEYVLRSCKGCPVYKHIGFSGCYGTPYEDVISYLEGLSDLFNLSEKFEAEVYQELAQKELDFLKSLRK